MSPSWKRIAVGLWVAACLAFFLYRADGFIRDNSATFDEAVHLSAGYSYWTRGDFRLNHETPPLSKLIAALPLFLFKHPKFEPTPEQWTDSAIWQIGNDFVFRNVYPPEEMLAWGRWATVPLGIALNLLIGWWAYRRFGLISGCATFGLACVEPNLLAFSCLVNSDMCLTLFTFASAYCSWEYFQSARKLWFVLSGIAIGLSLASKFSALFFLPGLLICWLLQDCRIGFQPVRNELELGHPYAVSPSLRTGWKPILRSNFESLFRLLFIAALTVLICYFLVGFAHFGQGFKQQLSRNDFDPPEFYMNHEVSTEGWYNYFIRILFMKQELIFRIFLIRGLMSLCLLWTATRNNSIFLLPALGFFAILTVLKVDLGIRIILPVIPFMLLVAASYDFTSWRIGIWSLVALSGLLIGIQIANWVYHPAEEIAFCETLWPIGNTDTFDKTKYLYMGDSNLDWGQDLLRLKKWMQQHGRKSVYLAYAGSAPAEAYGISFVPLPAWGRVEPYPPVPDENPDCVAVSVSCIQGLHLKNRDAYKSFGKPVSYLGGAIWVYDLQTRPTSGNMIERLAEQVPHGQ